MALLHTEIDFVLQEAARIAAEYLKEHHDPGKRVLRATSPAKLQQELDLGLPAQGRPMESILGELPQWLDRSVRTGHPGFFNQLFGGYDLAAIVGEWMTAILNSSMYTYEVAPVATLMETALIRRMGGLAGFPDGEGVFAPGGSISNLMAVLAARNTCRPQVKQKGLQAQDRLVMFASADAHYSLKRAASIVGLGVEGLRPVPVDEVGRMQPEALAEMVDQAKAEGLQPFMVAATCSTTVPGAFDPIPPIADLAERHGLWLHLDASMGGTVLFSETHRSLMQGSERADSITWNPHKMMGVPLTCSALLLRRQGDLAASNALHADYLFHDDPEVSCDLGDLSIQCGRRMDAIKLWLSWQAHGDSGYRQRVDHLLSMASCFRDMIAARPAFKLVMEPQSFNVCFHYVPERLRSMAPGEARNAQLEVVTLALRDRLIASGRHMINFAPVRGVATFRMVVANPQVEESTLRQFLDEMEVLGADL
ncbi:MAG: glutamate decarboxylase [Planctomycetota bacterium]|nr:MAG: glutamate decarboxylase [Planctomycetota bacterium]